MHKYFLKPVLSGINLGPQVKEVVKPVEVECVDKLLCEGDPPDRVAKGVEGRGPEADPHHPGDHQHQGAAHTGLGGETDLELRFGLKSCSGQVILEGS